jgi:DNA-binding Lrp family transcriptional regulator
LRARHRQRKVQGSGTREGRGMNFEDLTPEDRERWERYVVTGLHAFLFVEHVATEGTLRDAVEALIGMIPGDDPDSPDHLPPSDHTVVLSATETVGPYMAFVHLWAPPRRLDLLQDFIAGTLWDLGLRGDYAVQGTAYTGPTGQVYALKIKRCDVVGFVRIWLSSDADRGAFDVMTSLSELDGFQGAATVFGSFDVLLVIEGQEVDDVAKVVMGGLQRIPGIARTETAFADYRRYDAVSS